jgi:hypothetical protein
MRFYITTVVATLLAGAAIVAGAAMPEVEARATDLTHKFTTTTAKVVDAAAGLTAKTASKGKFSNAESSAVAANYNVLYGCDGYNFSGACWYIGVTNFGGCFNIPYPVDNTLSSLLGVYTNVGCYVFTNPGCSGTYGYIDYNSGAIGVLASPFDNNISSIQCYILS